MQDIICRSKKKKICLDYLHKIHYPEIGTEVSQLVFTTAEGKEGIVFFLQLDSTFKPSNLLGVVS